MLASLVTIPAIFFGNGSPTNAIENNKYIKSFQKPKAIIAISAH